MPGYSRRAALRLLGSAATGVGIAGCLGGSNPAKTATSEPVPTATARPTESMPTSAQTTPFQTETPAEPELEFVSGDASCRTEGRAPSADTWPMARFDAGATGHAPANTPPDEFPLERAWLFSTAGQEVYAPLADETTVFAAAPHPNGTVSALDPATGEERWRFSRGTFLEGSPAVANDTVFAGLSNRSSGTSTIHALRVADGERRWRVPSAQGVETSIRVSGETLVYGSHWEDIFVAGIQAGSGKKCWHGSVSASPARVTGLAVSEGVVNLSTTRAATHTPRYDHLMAVDSETGDLLWAVETDTAPDSVSVTDGTVYAALGDDVLAMDAETGERRWELDSGIGGHSTLAITADTVYAGGSSARDDGRLTAIDSEAGSVRWTASVGEVGVTPVVVGDLVFSASTVFEPNAETGHLVALEKSTGDVLWHHTLPDTQISNSGDAGRAAISVVHGRLYVGTRDGRIIAFE